MELGRTIAANEFPMRTISALICLALLLTGCEQLGIEDPAKAAAAKEAAKEAEGKAIGGACRQTGRVLEDCYALYPKAQKAAVLLGWRDMDVYMRENKIETMAPPSMRSADIKPAEHKAEEAAEKPAGKAEGHG